MAITLTTADVVAIRQLRRSGFGAAIEAVLHKHEAEIRRAYEEEVADEATRRELDSTKQARHILFQKEL